MKGDFSHDSFDPAKHFDRVLLQQGRVFMDADLNEQAAIQRELLRALVVDLVGRRWRVGEGFAIGGATADDFAIGAGRCWLVGCRSRTTRPGAIARRRQGRRQGDDDGIPGGRSSPISKAGSGRFRRPRIRRHAIPLSGAS